MSVTFRGAGVSAMLPRLTHWLTESEFGSAFARHLLGEAELLEMAANRLNLSGDDELREMAELVRMTE